MCIVRDFHTQLYSSHMPYERKKKSQGYNTFLQIHQDKNLQYKLGDTAGNVFVTINNFDNQIDRQFLKVYST